MQKSKFKWVFILVLLSPIAMAEEKELLTNAPTLFNLQECIKESTKDCIAAACIENAPADCPSQCKGIAENKCHAIEQQKILSMPEKYD